MRILGSLALAGVSLLGISTPVLAQEAEDGAYASDEIIVQARRKDESIQDVPLVVNVVSQEKLNNLQIRNFQDITQAVPGLLLQPNSNGISVKSSVRGVNFDGNVSGANGTIEFYWNDAPLSAGVMFQSMYDIGNIEIMRGPQGTLRGRASPSGSIAVSARRPDMTEVGAFVNAQANTIGGWSVNGAINVPIVAEKIALRVAGSVDESEADRVRSINNPRDPFSKSKSGRISLRVQPFDDLLTLDTTYQVTDRNGLTYSQNESWNYVASQFGETFTPATPNTVSGGCTAGNPCYDLHDIKAKDRRSANSEPLTSSQLYKVWTWQAQVKLAGQVLTYVGGKTDQDLKASGPQDSGNIWSVDYAPAAYRYNGGRNNAYVGGGGQNLLFDQVTHSFSSQRSHELRLQSEDRILGIFDYVAGYFYHRQKAPTNLLSPGTGAALPTGAPASSSTAPTGPAFVPAIGQPGRMNYSLVTRRGITTEKSWFGNLTAHLGDATEVSGGLRRIHYVAQNVPYTSTCSQVNALATSPDPSGFVTCPLSKINDDHATVYSVTAKHRFSESLMVYGAFGTSWRAGPRVAYLSGRLTTASSNGSPAQTDYMQLPPEKSKSFELGFKSEWFDRRLTVNLAAYHQKYTNYPLRNGTAVTTINYQALNANGTGNSSPLTGARVGSQNFVSPVGVKVKGLELDFSARPADGLTISGNVNYALGKTGSFKIPCNDYYKLSGGAFVVGADGIPDANQATASLPVPAYSVTVIDTATGGSGITACQFSKQRAALSSPWSANLSGEYAMPVSEGSDVYFRGNYAWNGDSLNDPLNKYDNVKSYGLLSLFLGLRDADGAWDVSLYGKNVGNAFRVINRLNGRGTTAGVPGNYATV
ncbi:MAG: hypothetical protein RIQ46_696, partial [Pseudomonadota bacterium]